METKFKVKTTSAGYNEARNFINLPYSEFAVERSRDFFNVLNFAYFKMFKKNDPRYLNLHLDIGLGGQRIHHFFNKINLNRNPWVVTFETALPRWNVESKWGLKQLAKDNCRKLIAMSDCAYNIQMHHLNRNDAWKDEIQEKLMVMHPAQRLMIGSYEEKQFPDERIHFTMIGAEFFRKGGHDMLRAFDRLLTAGYNASLHIISAMEYGDYASRTTKDDLIEAQRLIAKWPDHIFHRTRVPNTEVMALMKNSHVGLLPTYGETYGYSVLEAQANGCPVITTNVRALPEINNNEVGWLIEVPKDHLGNGLLSTPQERAAFSKTVEEGVFNAMVDIMENPHLVKEKGLRSMARIQHMHNPADKAAALERIYGSIIEDYNRAGILSSPLATLGRRVSTGVARATTQAYGMIMKNSFLG